MKECKTSPSNLTSLYGGRKSGSYEDSAPYGNPVFQRFPGRFALAASFG
jgi:hypothetical protein